MGELAQITIRRSTLLWMLSVLLALLIGAALGRQSAPQAGRYVWGPGAMAVLDTATGEMCMWGERGFLWHALREYPTSRPARP